MAPASVARREFTRPSTSVTTSVAFHTEPPRRNPAWKWPLITVGSYLTGMGAEAAGLPAPWLLAALLTGAVLALSGVVRERLPSPVNRAGQSLVGALMGSYLTSSALMKAAPAALPLTLVTAATITLSVAIAWCLSRARGLGHPTAVLGMVPGGSAAIVASADELGADARLVAFTQYLRVGLVATTAPLIAQWLTAGPGTAGGPVAQETAHRGLLHLVAASDQQAGLLTLLAVVWVGTFLGRRLKLPTPALIGPMLAGLAVTMSGLLPGFAPTGLLQNLVFVLVGLDVGVRFTKETLLLVRRVLPSLLLALTAMCLGCAGLAWLFARAAGTPVMDAYLATTPGGINAVIATAVSSHADVALISAVQSLRLLIVVFATPWIIRLVATSRPAWGKGA
ncbi:AbrB family transcriptional regulator [Streptomyces sp. NPDC006309]|uniref:AbrB family transcriptional regulator n=1 Tax=Streptomyces sp. NPDC006309 TaxID=3156749 RepID=UPI0033B330A8